MNTVFRISSGVNGIVFNPLHLGHCGPIAGRKFSIPCDGGLMIVCLPLAEQSGHGFERTGEESAPSLISIVIPRSITRQHESSVIRM
jgi:hypothetical protein